MIGVDRALVTLNGIEISVVLENCDFFATLRNNRALFDRDFDFLLNSGIEPIIPEGKCDVTLVSVYGDAFAVMKEKHLKPVHPHILAGINDTNRFLTKNFPNATYWEGNDGKWYFMEFTSRDFLWSGVHIVAHTPGRLDFQCTGMWIAGVKKK